MYFGIVQRGKGDDRHADSLFSNLADTLLPVHLGHHQVDEDDVGTNFLDATERRDAIGTSHHVEPFVLEEKIDYVEGGDIVVDDEDLAVVHCCLSPANSHSCAERSIM